MDPDRRSSTADETNGAANGHFADNDFDSKPLPGESPKESQRTLGKLGDPIVKERVDKVLYSDVCQSLEDSLSTLC